MVEILLDLDQRIFRFKIRITELEPFEITRIEEIVYPVIKYLPYQFTSDVTYRPLNKLLLKFLTIYDGIAMVKFNVYDKGVINGIKHYYQMLVDSSII